MSKFKVGDRVKCVDADGFNRLIHGGHYTVKHVDSDGYVGLDNSMNVYNQNRFELINENVENKPSEAPQQEIPKILIEKSGELARIEIVGNLSSKQVKEILDVVYGNTPDTKFYDKINRISN